MLDGLAENQWQQKSHGKTEIDCNVNAIQSPAEAGLLSPSIFQAIGHDPISPSALLWYHKTYHAIFYLLSYHASQLPTFSHVSSHL